VSVGARLPAPAPATLPGAGEVHVWRAHPSQWCEQATRRRAQAMLAAEELARNASFRFATLRHRDLVTRLLCRQALSRCLPLPPSAWRFDAPPLQRPELAAPFARSELRFNLSHAGDVVLCALACGAAVGVDVEAAGRLDDAATLAAAHFAPSEAADVLACPATRRGERFLRYWTLKEAFAKAHGGGLSLPLDAYALRLGPPIGIAFDARIDEDPARWRFAAGAIDAAHPYAVALASPVPLRLRHFLLDADGAGHPLTAG
jgi:4'-phosphopantetheinyl transferase